MQKYLIPLFFILFLWGCDNKETSTNADLTKNYVFDPATINAIKVNSDSGKLFITHSDKAQDVQVTIKNKAPVADGCDVSASVEKGVLKLINKRKTGSKNLVSCFADFEIIVPGTIKTTNIDIGAGEINIQNLSTNLKINAGKVDLAINAPLKFLKIDAGTVDADIQNMLGDASLSCGFGNVNLRYNEITPPLNLTLKGGFINSTISVPKNKRVSYKLSNASKALEIKDKVNAYNDLGLNAQIDIGSGKIEFINN